MKCLNLISAVAAVALAQAVIGLSQAPTTAAPPPNGSAIALANAPRSIRTYHLQYGSSQAEQNELLTAIRYINTPVVKVFLIPSQNQIVVSGTEDELKTTELLLSKLDVPHRFYRLTYTFTDMDGGKRVGLQHYSMTLTPGQRMRLKEGSRVPILVNAGPGTDPKTHDRTYLDIGLNFDSQLDEYGSNGVRLSSKIEQSSIADERSGLGPEDPLIRQTLLEGTSVLTEGKPLALGSLDVPGTTRHIEVEALIESVR